MAWRKREMALGKLEIAWQKPEMAKLEMAWRKREMDW